MLGEQPPYIGKSSKPRFRLFRNHLARPLPLMWLVACSVPLLPNNVLKVLCFPFTLVAYGIFHSHPALPDQRPLSTPKTSLCTIACACCICAYLVHAIFYQCLRQRPLSFSRTFSEHLRMQSGVRANPHLKLRLKLRQATTDHVVSCHIMSYHQYSTGKTAR